MTAQLAGQAQQEGSGATGSEPREPSGQTEPDVGNPSPGRLRRLWNRGRVGLAVVAVVILGVVAIVLLAPQPKSNTYLDPASKDPPGAKALADILKDRGFDVIDAYSPSSAAADLASRSSATLVITSPVLLTAAERTELARARARAHADLVLIEPGRAALATFAPAVRISRSAGPFEQLVNPACDLPGARLAGSATISGISYRIPGDAIGCYPVNGSPTLVRYERAGLTTTILGSGQPFSNALLATEGNAALALNLLNGQPTIVWLTPEPTIAQNAPHAIQRAKPALIPPAAWLVVLQLGVALLLAALWRMRRLGPLITERLPVVVRASETVEGHARLYQSRRARDRAAAALRAAMLARTKPVLGLAAEASISAVAAELARRSRHTAPQIETILDGPPPATDADLVRLADDLDQLEREVRAQ